MCVFAMKKRQIGSIEPITPIREMENSVNSDFEQPNKRARSDPRNVTFAEPDSDSDELMELEKSPPAYVHGAPSSSSSFQ